MKELVAITLQNRKILYQILKRLPLESLNEIPVGYRNNIWWNIVHIIVTQQLLVYKLSNNKMKVNESLINSYRKGTVPEKKASAEEVELVAALLLSTAEGLQEDFENGLFKEFTPYTTSTGTTIKSVGDALAFNLFHEGLHLGVVLSLEKLVLTTAPS